MSVRPFIWSSLSDRHGLRRQILRDFFGIGYLVEPVSVFRRLREHIGAHDLEQFKHAVETEF